MSFSTIMKIILAIFFQFIRILGAKHADESVNSLQEQFVVRAVFIKCKPNNEQNFFESEASRFQREELFKHSALQGCHQKLALSVKITSEPNKSSGDEYVPIEHVFDGSNRRRARLLNPYILRLRRDTWCQAYKLRRIDTVTGILTKTHDRRTDRVQRNLNGLPKQDHNRNSGLMEQKPSVMDLQSLPFVASDDLKTSGETEHCNEVVNSTKPRIRTPKESQRTKFGDSFLNISENQSDENQNKHNMKDNIRVKRDCTLANNPTWNRDKRHEHNITVEELSDDYKLPWGIKDGFYRLHGYPNKSGFFESDKTITLKEDRNSRKDKVVLTKTKASVDQDQPLDEKNLHDISKMGNSKKEKINLVIYDIKDTPLIDKSSSLEELISRKNMDKKSKSHYQNKNTAEKTFELYDIGSPDLWYNVHVQLFEKMSTPEGRSVWNDVTKGKIASVNTVQLEWMDQNVNVKYKPMEWTSKDDFTLPSTTNLSLLVPILEDGTTGLDDEIIGQDTIDKYIVVPKDDIVSLEDNKSGLSERGVNFPEITADTRNEEGRYHRVLVRVSRALLTEKGGLKVSRLGADQFLTLPHPHRLHAQIDLEARADENQLVRVGSSGSLNTIVTENSRRSRSVITVQVTNKGLAAARFRFPQSRVRARDCGPEIANVMNENDEGITAGPTLVAPRHTRRFRLVLPTEFPGDSIHCSVTLINDDEESVAVRDVAVKKGDRCFCVWHCDCVCLSEDPKLSCREMAETRQAVAGLSPRERPRLARSVCYEDCVSVNIFVVIMGVLMVLLFLGLVKACLGLFCRCVSTFGLERLVQTPRRLERYYEPSLQGRPVVYDEDGRPVHPDTKKRSVRQISKSMEFMLNLTIFITLPCMLVRDAIKILSKKKDRREDASVTCSACTSRKGRDKCFSTHDMQGRGRQPRWRRRGLRCWMSPQAEELSKDIWSKGFSTKKTNECEFMRPLLHGRRGRGACAETPAGTDSEQDDTEYVLMQMQRSKESLARSHKKNINKSVTSSTRNKLNAEAKPSSTPR